MISQEVIDLYGDIRQRSDKFHENWKLGGATKASEARQEKKNDSLQAQISSHLKEYTWVSIVMRSSLHWGLLEPFQKNLRKTSKKAIQQIVQHCVTRFSGVAKSGFLESGFQEMLTPSDDVLNTFLRRYCVSINGHRPEAWTRPP
jgi:hypothetical protein